MIRGAKIVRTAALLLFAQYSVCVSLGSDDNTNSISQIPSDTATDVMEARMGELLFSIDERLSSLEQRLDQVLGTKTFPRALNPSVPFQITRVMKKDIGDYFQVRVEYEASAFPNAIQMLWDSHRTEIELDRQEFGAVEVEFPKHNHISDRDVRDVTTALVFVFQGSLYEAELRLYNTPDIMDVPPIHLHVAEGSDVTFKPRVPKVVLHVVLKTDSEHVDALSGDGLRAWVYAENQIPTSTGPRRDSEPEIQVERERGGEHGDRLWEVGVWSDSGDPEGVLLLLPAVVFDCRRNCLLKGLDARLSVQLRREDHPAALPEGSLQFSGDDFASEGLLKYCTVPREDYWPPCVIDCEVFGAGTSVTADITKVAPDGDVMASEDDVALSMGWWSFTQLSIVNASFEDSGVYRCTGRSGARNITRDITVAVIRPAKIDPASLYLRGLDNGSVVGVCVAEGVPAPEVTLYANYMNLDSSGLDTYTLTVTQLNESTRAEVVFTDPHEASTIFTLGCSATNIQDGYRTGRYEAYRSVRRDGVSDDDDYAYD